MLTYLEWLWLTWAKADLVLLWISAVKMTRIT
jgi:hypothetical protein